MSNIVCPAPPVQPVFVPHVPLVQSGAQEYLEEMLANPRWSAVCDAIASLICQMTVKRAAPNKTGRQVHVVVTCPVIKVIYEGRSELILPTVNKMGSPVRTFEVRFKGPKTRSTREVFSELAGQLAETAVVPEGRIEYGRTLRKVLASCAMRARRGVNGVAPLVVNDYQAGYFLMQEVARRVDVNSPSLVAIRDAHASASAASRKAFSNHVVTKVKGDILKLATACFLHGAEMEEMKDILDQAMVASVMNR